MEPPPLGSREVNVYLKPSGCTEIAMAVGSLGIVPLYMAFFKRKMPGRLTEEAMFLRDGTRVPWDRFRRTKRTDIYYGQSKVFMGSRYELWFEGGKSQFGTRMLTNGDEVVSFILRHLPDAARGPGT